MNKNLEFLDVLAARANAVKDLLPRRIVWSYDRHVPFFAHKSVKGYFIKTTHRNLYLETPELKDFIRQINIAEGKQIGMEGAEEDLARFDKYMERRNVTV